MFSIFASERPGHYRDYYSCPLEQFKMILEALFLTALVMSSFYMCEAVNEVSTSKCGREFDEAFEEYSEEIAPQIGPEEDPSIDTIFTITLSSNGDGDKVAVEDRWSGPGALDVADEGAGEKESFLERRGKGPMRLHFRVAWRENPLFNEVVA